MDDDEWEEKLFGSVDDGDGPRVIVEEIECEVDSAGIAADLDRMITEGPMKIDTNFFEEWTKNEEDRRNRRKVLSVPPPSISHLLKKLPDPPSSDSDDEPKIPHKSISSSKKSKSSISSSSIVKAKIPRRKPETKVRREISTIDLRNRSKISTIDQPDRSIVSMRAQSASSGYRSISTASIATIDSTGDRPISSMDDEDQPAESRSIPNSIDRPQSQSIAQSINQYRLSASTDQSISKSSLSTLSTDNRDRSIMIQAFLECLVLRAQNSDDIFLTADEIYQLVVQLESKICEHSSTIKNRRDTRSSYQRRCQDILTHLRNRNNPWLFRRFLLGQLSCEQVATMSLDELGRVNNKGSVKKLERNGSSTIADGLRPRTMDTTGSHRNHLFDKDCKKCTMGEGRNDGKRKQILSKKSPVPPPPVRKRCLDSSYSSNQSGSSPLRMVLDDITMITDPDFDQTAIPNGVDSTPAKSTGTSQNQPDPTPTKSNRSTDDPMVSFLDQSSTSLLNEFAQDSKISTAGLSPADWAIVEMISSTPLASTQESSPIKESQRFASPIWRGQVQFRDRIKFAAQIIPIDREWHERIGDDFVFPSIINVKGRTPKSDVLSYVDDIRRRCAKKYRIWTFRLDESKGDDESNRSMAMKKEWTKFYDYCGDKIGTADVSEMRLVKDVFLFPMDVGERPDAIGFGDMVGLDDLDYSKRWMLGVMIRQHGDGNKAIVDEEIYKYKSLNIGNSSTSDSIDHQSSSQSIVCTSMTKSEAAQDDANQWPESSLTENLLHDLSGNGDLKGMVEKYLNF